MVSKQKSSSIKELRARLARVMPDPHGVRIARKIVDCGTESDGARWTPIGDSPVAVKDRIVRMTYPVHSESTLVTMEGDAGTTIIIYFVAGKPKSFFLVPHPESQR